MKDGFGEEEAFEGVKGGLARRGPVPGEVLFGEVEERAGDVGVIRDESSVEIGETKKRVNVFHLSWCRPICDAIEFDGVHGQLAGLNNHSKVFYVPRRWRTCTFRVSSEGRVRSCVVGHVSCVPRGGRCRGNR